MGTTHRTYKLKDKNISVLEAAQILWKIQDSLCTSPTKSFYHQFSLTESHRIQEIHAKFDVQVSDLLSHFTLREHHHLYEIINLPDLFKTISLNNFKEGVTKIDYLHYWIQINADSFPIFIILPITDDFVTIKSELKNIAKFLSGKKLLSLSDKELDEMVNLLIDSNLHFSDGTTYRSNGLAFFARGDFHPKGCKYVRPSSIRLKFDNAYYEKHGGEHKTLLAFYDAFNEYFEKEKYSIKGTVVSKFGPDTFTALDKFDFLKFDLRVYIDLRKNLHFTPHDLLLTSTPCSVTVENFDWKGGDPNFGDNRMRLSIENFEDWDFELQISKQIDEEYYFNIELLIDRELEYKGLE
ncbi:MAG TPA: hypothetical protein VIN08_23105 [Ohtaekwangia sp.]|uniref:hypothetical protein n=1 Tax=Ohtaekwangia sp. TaxID=2066019 RepID=UPI002F95B4DD